MNQTSRYLTGCFYVDSTGLLAKQYENTASPGVVTATLQTAVNAENKGQWLLLMRPQGILEVRLLAAVLLAVFHQLSDMDSTQACSCFFYGWIINPSKCPRRLS